MNETISFSTTQADFSKMAGPQQADSGTDKQAGLFSSMFSGMLPDKVEDVRESRTADPDEGVIRNAEGSSVEGAEPSDIMIRQYLSLLFNIRPVEDRPVIALSAEGTWMPPEGVNDGFVPEATTPSADSSFLSELKSCRRGGSVFFLVNPVGSDEPIVGNSSPVTGSEDELKTAENVVLTCDYRSEPKSKSVPAIPGTGSALHSIARNDGGEMRFAGKQTDFEAEDMADAAEAIQGDAEIRTFSSGDTGLADESSGVKIDEDETPVFHKENAQMSSDLQKETPADEDLQLHRVSKDVSVSRQLSAVYHPVKDQTKENRPQENAEVPHLSDTVKPEVVSASIETLRRQLTGSSETRHAGEPSDAMQIQEYSLVVTKRNGSSVEISVEPDGLGRLEIELNLDSGMLHARISASEERVREMIERNLHTILDTLVRDGISIGEFSVSHRQRSDGGWREVKPSGMGEGEGTKEGYDSWPLRRGNDNMISIFV